MPISRTHRVALDWLFDRIIVDAKIKIKFCRNQTPFCRQGTSHVMSGTIFFICVTSATSAFSAALRISALTRCTKTVARKGWKSDRGKVKADDEPGFHRLDKFSDSAESDCVEKPRDTQSTMLNRFVKLRETGSTRSAKHDAATRCTPGTPEFLWRFNEYEETRRFRKLRDLRQIRFFATLNENSWKLIERRWSRTAESAQRKKMQSRHAEDCTMSIQELLEVETNLSFQSNHPDKGATNSFEGFEKHAYRFDASRGWRHFLSSTTHSFSSSSSRWQPSSDLWSTWN